MNHDEDLVLVYWPDRPWPSVILAILLFAPCIRWRIPSALAEQYDSHKHANSRPVDTLSKELIVHSRQGNLGMLVSATCP
jgi:hypothetical protein